MTQKEKFLEIIKTETDRHAECEKIADEYAIEFGQWITKFDNLHNESKYLIKELLEIFKKEKGWI